MSARTSGPSVQREEAQMTKIRLLVAGVAVVLVSFLVSACKEEQKAAGAPVAEKKAEAAKVGEPASVPPSEAKEAPAAQKPKDHPAH